MGFVASVAHPCGNVSDTSSWADLWLRPDHTRTQPFGGRTLVWPAALAVEHPALNPTTQVRDPPRSFLLFAHLLSRLANLTAVSTRRSQRICVSALIEIPAREATLVLRVSRSRPPRPHDDLNPSGGFGLGELLKKQRAQSGFDW